MVDVREGQERMQQRFDRRSPGPRVQQRSGDQVGHLFIAHRAAITQRQQFIETQSRVVRIHRAAHVRTGALDPHHPLLTSEVIDNQTLGRCVSTPVDNERWVVTDSIGSSDELMEGLQRVGHRFSSATSSSTSGVCAGSTTPCSVTIADT